MTQHLTQLELKILINLQEDTYATKRFLIKKLGYSTKSMAAALRKLELLELIESIKVKTGLSARNTGVVKAYIKINE